MKKLLIMLRIIIAIPTRLFSKLSIFSAILNSTVDKTAAISANTRFYNSKIGKYSYIGHNCSVCNTEIGNFCSISDRCTIGGAGHPMSWVSTSPVFCKGQNILHFNFSEFDYEPYLKTTIGNDVWIGINVFVKSGVKIGDGAIIGACSVVTKDVDPYTIVVGNPARQIRQRFSNEISKELLSSEWWNWSDDKIRRQSLFIMDPEAFIQNIHDFANQ
jgi:acetyltransferase-like isoleucine patch superfamily enzyme